MIFEIIGEPVGKMRPRATNKGGYVRMYTPTETVNYESFVKLSFVNAFPEHVLITKPIVMKIWVYKRIADSIPAKKRELMLSGDLQVETKPDLDNIIKTICDALNNVAYVDDRLIVGLFATKQYSEVSKVVVEINEYVNKKENNNGI